MSYNSDKIMAKLLWSSSAIKEYEGQSCTLSCIGEGGTLYIDIADDYINLGKIMGKQIKQRKQREYCTITTSIGKFKFLLEEPVIWEKKGKVNFYESKSDLEKRRIVKNMKVSMDIFESIWSEIAQDIKEERLNKLKIVK